MTKQEKKFRPHISKDISKKVTLKILAKCWSRGNRALVDIMKSKIHPWGITWEANMPIMLRWRCREARAWVGIEDWAVALTESQRTRSGVSGRSQERFSLKTCPSCFATKSHHYQHRKVLYTSPTRKYPYVIQSHQYTYSTTMLHPSVKGIFFIPTGVKRMWLHCVWCWTKWEEGPASAFWPHHPPGAPVPE